MVNKGTHQLLSIVIDGGKIDGIKRISPYTKRVLVKRLKYNRASIVQLITDTNFRLSTEYYRVVQLVYYDSWMAIRLKLVKFKMPMLKLGIK